jgi:hypothetical protein
VVAHLGYPNWISAAPPGRCCDSMTASFRIPLLNGVMDWKVCGRKCCGLMWGHVPGGPEGNHEERQPGYPVDLLRALPLGPTSLLCFLPSLTFSSRYISLSGPFISLRPPLLDDLRIQVQFLVAARDFSLLSV